MSRSLQSLCQELPAIVPTCARPLRPRPCLPASLPLRAMQVQTNVGRPTDPTLYRNMFHALWRIGSTEGLRGLYRGLGIAVVGSGPASAAFFTSYEVRCESRGRAVDDCPSLRDTHQLSSAYARVV